jgi:hypothetical protein
MAVQFDGFDWDDGNWPKCGKHGLEKSAIESLFAGEVFVQKDKSASQVEARFNAVGKTSEWRYTFVVFTLREIGGSSLVRPISARYMHQKEVLHYEAQIRP